MSSLVDVRACVIVPNWNGLDHLAECLDSLLAQSHKGHVIVVDNGSVDGSSAFIQEKYPDVELIQNLKNEGYAGGVNAGFRRAIELGVDYAAPFNNDAFADEKWLENLVGYLDSHKEAGIACCKLLSADGKTLDSTGDYVTVWGLPYPRGRGENDINKYDSDTEVFGASGGASLYRIKMLKEIGLFDEDFFAYYEDVDLSFRAQLAGWKVGFVPEAIAYHHIGATSNKIPGFATYQTLKNLPLLLNKNIPRGYLLKVGLRFDLAYFLFFMRAVSRGHGWSALKGVFMAAFLTPTSLMKRHGIQKNMKVSPDYIWKMLMHDLPPNAQALRKVRSAWWKLRDRHE